MIRIFKVYYPLRLPFLLFSEVFIVGLSFLFAAVVLFQRDSYLLLTYDYGLAKIAVLTAVCVTGFHYFDLYDLQRVNPASETYFRLLVVLGMFALFLATLERFFPQMIVGQGVLFLGTLLLTVGLLCWRFLFRYLSQAEIFREPVLILGDGAASRELVGIIRERTDWGWKPLLFDCEARGQGENGRGSSSLHETVARLGVRRVIVAFEERRGRMPIQELARLRMVGVTVEDAATALEKLTGRIHLQFTSASWIAFSSGFRVSRLRYFQKRLVSTVVSLVLLLISFPFLLLISLAILMESGGPVLFRQRRVGQHGRIFHALKFRSMVPDTEANGFQPAAANDSRITRVGRFLRPWHLDELPQLVNILRGEMSFVGPRPFVPEWEERLEKAIPFYNLRHVVKPGLTGWAQVNRGYCETVEDNREKLEFDLFYIKNMSVLSDLWIIFQTGKIVLFGRGAR